MKKLFIFAIVILAAMAWNGCILDPDDESRDDDSNTAETQRIADQNTADQNTNDQEIAEQAVDQPVEKPIWVRVLIARSDAAENFIGMFEGVTIWSNSALESVDGVRTNAVNTNSEGEAYLAFPEGTGVVRIEAECGWTQKATWVDLSEIHVLYLTIYPYENFTFFTIKVVRVQNDGSLRDYEGATVWSSEAFELYIEGQPGNHDNTDSEGMATLVFHKNVEEAKIHIEHDWTEENGWKTEIRTVDISQSPDLLVVEIK